jgi:hypothetical protein
MRTLNRASGTSRSTASPNATRRAAKPSIIRDARLEERAQPGGAEPLHEADVASGAPAARESGCAATMRKEAGRASAGSGLVISNRPAIRSPFLHFSIHRVRGADLSQLRIGRAGLT